ncbi:hypothetical protein Pla52o_36770 [Novipirellula galeiformis]|uniref:Uncharacterized protein n=1 Tax=Novipirellula galeiformis TaxID=2528004 RepID=A0A5C6CA76_9BACT|nr:hypothetical protein Pla52o_36770 [Novipirellula galeiformis]
MAPNPESKRGPPSGDGSDLKVESKRDLGGLADLEGPEFRGAWRV